MRYQVVALENETDTVVSVDVPISVTVELCTSAVYDEIAVGIMIKTANDVKKRGLAASRRSEHADKLVLSEAEIDSLQSVYGFGGGDIILLYAC